jgi:anaerobic ribonucleoside-triphosphate reductase
MEQNLLTFHEKADELVEEAEELRSKHIEYLRESAMLLTEEGKLISNVQGIGSEEYDMDEYVSRMEKIVMRNLEIYGDLQNRLL